MSRREKTGAEELKFMSARLSRQIVLLGAVSLVFVVSVLAGDLSPRDVVLRWVQFYGQDTVQAMALTTAYFHDDESQEAWAAKTQHALEDVGYGHVGGTIESETTSGEVATVILNARIVAVDGVSTQTEIYTLKHISGRWLIDALEVKDEIVPRGKLSHAF